MQVHSLVMIPISLKKKNESLWGWGGNVSGIFPHTLLSLKVKLLKPSLLIMQEIHKSMS